MEFELQERAGATPLRCHQNRGGRSRPACSWCNTRFFSNLNVRSSLRATGARAVMCGQGMPNNQTILSSFATHFSFPSLNRYVEEEMSRYPTAKAHQMTHHESGMPRRQERGSVGDALRYPAGGTVSLLASTNARQAAACDGCMKVTCNPPRHCPRHRMSLQSSSTAPSRRMAKSCSKMP